MLEVVIMGTGNVAKHLFDAFSISNDIGIVQVLGRTPEALEYFEKRCQTSSNFQQVRTADIYIIAVSDDSIPSVSQFFTDKKGLVVHTSGSRPIDTLSQHRAYGVFYPLQSFSKNWEVNFKSVPVCIEAKNKKGLKLLHTLASSISDRVYEVVSDQRRSLHLAAVFVNNFTNHLYHIGNHICEENHVPFDLLHPLLLETAKKIERLSPHASQTGPARRGDTQTIASHLKQLHHTGHKEIYSFMSQSIQKIYGEEL